MSAKDVFVLTLAFAALGIGFYFSRVVWSVFRQSKMRRPFAHDVWVALGNALVVALGCVMVCMGLSDPWGQETQRSIAGAHGWSLAFLGAALVVLMTPFCCLSVWSLFLRLRTALASRGRN